MRNRLAPYATGNAFLFNHQGRIQQQRGQMEANCLYPCIQQLFERVLSHEHGLGAISWFAANSTNLVIILLSSGNRVLDYDILPRFSRLDGGQNKLLPNINSIRRSKVVRFCNQWPYIFGSIELPRNRTKRVAKLYLIGRRQFKTRAV
jgi:hypothetical protein